MDPVLVTFLFGISAFLIWLFSHSLHSGSRGQNLKERVGHEAASVADALEAKMRQGKYFFTDRVSGAVEAYPVAGVNVLEVTLSYRAPDAGNFEITWEGTLSRAKKRIGLNDVTVGDPRFDGKILVTASEPWKMSAFLNAGVRNKILKLQQSGINFLISGEKCRIERDFDDSVRDRSMGKYLTLAGGIAGEFTRKVSLVTRLAENVLYDGETDVRVNCLRALSEHFGGEEVTLKTLRQCLEDRALSVRFEAALGLGDEGMDHLALLLVRGEELKPVERTRIIRLFGERGYRNGVPALLDLYHMVTRDEKLDILKSLELLGDPSCADFLLKLLGMGDSEVRSGLIDALAACGTLETVKRLRTLAKVVKREMIHSVYDDIADRIAARLGITGGGRLSIPETSPMEGAMSRYGGPGKGDLSGGEGE